MSGGRAAVQRDRLVYFGPLRLMTLLRVSADLRSDWRVAWPTPTPSDDRLGAMIRRLARLARGGLLLAALTCGPDAASAQDATFRVGLLAGVAAGDDEAPVTVAGSFGYRFAPGFWFDGELTWIGEGPFDSGYLAIPVPLPLPGSLPMPNADGGVIPSGESSPVPVVTERPTVVGILSLRWEPPSPVRLRPYLTGGLGLHRTEERLRLDVDPRTVLSDAAFSGSAFAVGGGGTLRVSRPVSVDVDGRYLRLSGGRDLLRLTEPR